MRSNMKSWNKYIWNETNHILDIYICAFVYFIVFLLCHCVLFFWNDMLQVFAVQGKIISIKNKKRNLLQLKAFTQTIQVRFIRFMADVRL